MHNHSLPAIHRRLAVENLKRCPLCGTVNSKQNKECFVCRWRGEFNSDAYCVEEGLIEILEECPELVDCILYVPNSHPTFFDRMRDWVRKHMRGSLDLEA